MSLNHWISLLSQYFVNIAHTVGIIHKYSSIPIFFGFALHLIHTPFHFHCLKIKKYIFIGSIFFFPKNENQTPFLHPFPLVCVSWGSAVRSHTEIHFHAICCILTPLPHVLCISFYVLLKTLISCANFRPVSTVVVYSGAASTRWTHTLRPSLVVSFIDPAFNQIHRTETIETY